MRTVGEQVLAANQALFHRLQHDFGKNPLENIAVVKAANAILTQHTRVNDFLRQAHVQKPTIGDVDFDFFDQLALAGGYQTDNLAA